MSPKQPPKRHYPSGAQKRKKKAADQQQMIEVLQQRASTFDAVVLPRTELEALRAELAAAKAAGADGEPPVLDDGSAEFAKCGPPPLEDPETALSWVRKLQLTAVHLATTRVVTRELEARLRWVKDLGATAGMTHSRASTEGRLKKVEGELNAVKAARGAVVTERADQVARPETARGRGHRRGPRPVPGPGPGTPPSEDA